MIFINPLAEGIDLPALVLYGVLAVVTLLVFFLSMQLTHRVLAEAKTKELKEVEGSIVTLFRSLKAHKMEGGGSSSAATELNLWYQYEERLKDTRTWPYNTAMIRTLFFSVLLPAVASAVQRYVAGLFVN